MNKTKVINHPLLSQALFYLRSKYTGMSLFRKYSDIACELLLMEACKDLETDREEVETPLSKTVAQKIISDVVVIPILRAGLSMLPTLMRYLPEAKIGLVGLVRDEKTAIAQEYYLKLPLINKKTTVFITDPMLATGGSICHLLNDIKKYNPKRIKIISIVSAPEGIKKIIKEFPQVEIITAAIDKTLNTKKFIVPGLGDFGDRYFGTDSTPLA